MLKENGNYRQKQMCLTLSFRVVLPVVLFARDCSVPRYDMAHPLTSFHIFLRVIFLYLPISSTNPPYSALLPSVLFFSLVQLT